MRHQKGAEFTKEMRKSHVILMPEMLGLHEMYPEINIQTIEYDYDSSKSLRESRILLGLSDIGQRSEI